MIDSTHTIDSTHRYCATRALKNARYVQAHVANLIPALEPQEGFASIIPFSQLCRLHLIADAESLPGRLRGLASALPLPAIATTAQTPLFDGTLYLARITFSPNGASGTRLAVPAADVTTAIRFLNLACPPISAYASAYGANRLSVSPTAIEYAVTLPAFSYNDQTLQGWIDQIATQNGLDRAASCIVVLSPQGVVNTDADSTQGILGYHGLANVPYCFANVFGQGFTIDDAADVFAWQLSHEVAEMTVDPTANLANPEVCDPCGPNCPPNWRSFFDASGYRDTSSSFPPGFSYSFFINAIVQPPSAAQCPAPAAACRYAPPAG